ncbi:MAG: NAD(P)/FAD-dependent oxidoreductase [Ilumatobacteraceae bacterium]
MEPLTRIASAARKPVWHDAATPVWNLEQAPPHAEVDVAIVGGGFSGLWTAYYFSLARPDLSIAVIESSRVGFGASGRNGGWCSGMFALSPADLAAQFGREAALHAYRESFATLDVIEAVLARENIDCAWHRGGSITSATIPLQRERLQRDLRAQYEAGIDDSDLRWLEPNAVREEMNLADTHGAIYTPHCATVNPYLLVLGLARTLRRRGVQLWEESRVTGIDNGVVTHVAASRTVGTRSLGAQSAGTIHAGLVVQATEGYSAAFRQTRRTMIPLYSLMVATEPLPKHVLKALHWSKRATFTDGGRMIIYAQLTDDGRIAIGGRGAPYHFGSRVRASFDIDDDTHVRIVKAIERHFPAAAGARITHRWGGPLGVPRDWTPFVIVNRAAKYARIGGYTGDGVACTNLLARTVVDEWLQRDTSLRRLPFVGHHNASWEPEPVRFMGVNALINFSNSIDRFEARTGRSPRVRTALLEKFL